MPWGTHLGGYPARSSRRGELPCQVRTGGVPWPRGYQGRIPPQVRTGGVSWPGGYQGRIPPGQVRTGEVPWAGGCPGQGVPWLGGLTWPGGYPGRVPPGQVGGYPAGGYPVRKTEGVFTTRRAVCLLRSRRRTFLFGLFYWFTEGCLLKIIPREVKNNISRKVTCT